MAQLFAHVELRGTPSAEVYKNLHGYMLSKNWSQFFEGAGLPNTMYQAASVAHAPDLPRIANGLKADIEHTIWNRASIFIVRAADWANTIG